MPVSRAVNPFVPILAALVIAFIAGTPIAFVLALGGMLYFIITGDAPLVTVPAAYQAGIGSFILLAIPFFMLAGALMDVTGMAARLIDMVQEWVGHWRGGLLQAQMVAIYIFSGISGSKVADMATVGGIMKKPLRERGYPPSESVAVLAAAAAMGEVIPPSIMLLILGSITTLSVGSLFVAGILPAALLAAALGVGIAIRSRAYGFPKGPAFHLRPRVEKHSDGVAGADGPADRRRRDRRRGRIADRSVVIRRGVRLPGGGSGLPFGARRDDLAGPAGRSADGRHDPVHGRRRQPADAIDRDRRIGTAIGDLLDARCKSPTEFLFLSVAALVVLGFVLEGLPAILIAAPILLPVAEQMHIDSLQCGILLVMAIGIGVFMPPVGIGFYQACALGDAPAGPTMRPALIYTSFLLIGLVLAILLPQVTLWLPHLFGLH